MKIISWNINGLKSWSETEGVFELLEKEKPDIFCVQEIKTSASKVKEDFKNILKEFPFQYYSFAEKKGYSGTAIFSRKKPLRVVFGLKNDKHENIDREGRVITLEFDNFFIANVYTPNSKIDFSRLEYRTGVWDTAFLEHLKRLKDEKEVLVCGDLNVLERDIDLQNYTYYFKNEEFKEKILQERKSFERFLVAGFADVYRYLYPEKVVFTWVGPQALQLPSTRLDYFLATHTLRKKVQSAGVYSSQKGSDHFPIYADFTFNFSEKNLSDEKREKILFPEEVEKDDLQESLF